MIYEHDGATLSIQMDPRLLLGVVDRIVGMPAMDCVVRKNPDWHRDTRNAPWRTTRWGWLDEIGGLELGVEMTDATFWRTDPRWPDRGVHRQESGLTERDFQLIGTDWTVNFRFHSLGMSGMGDCMLLGLCGYLLEPVIRGSLEGWQREMTVLRIFHDTNTRHGRSIRLQPSERFQHRTQIDAWYVT